MKRKSMLKFKIPKTIPKTQSWLFMPLIFMVLIPSNKITQPFSFDLCIERVFEDLNEIFNPLPYNIKNFADIIEYLKNHMSTIGINNHDDLPYDNKYHINGQIQEVLLKTNDDFFGCFVNSLVNNIIEICDGEEFLIGFK